MPERELVDQKARAFFDEMWKSGDPWKLETSDFEQDKYRRQLALLEARRFADVLEIGCGAGFFTRRLSQIADRVVGLDVSAKAIAQAQQTKSPDVSVEFQVVNIMDYDVGRSGPWDLIVMSETIYYLGWLYTFFDIAWFASELFAATRAGGQLLMANTFGGVEDYLLRPSIIRTYRDLFLNSGYRVNAEEVFSGEKNGANIDVLISLFGKPL